MLPQSFRYPSCCSAAQYTRPYAYINASPLAGLGVGIGAGDDVGIGAGIGAGVKADVRVRVGAGVDVHEGVLLVNLGSPPIKSSEMRNPWHARDLLLQCSSTIND